MNKVNRVELLTNIFICCVLKKNYNQNLKLSYTKKERKKKTYKTFIKMQKLLNGILIQVKTPELNF